MDNSIPSKIFKDVIEILSRDMNNQIISISINNNELIQLQKYQVTSEWGIRIIIDRINIPSNDDSMKDIIQSLVQDTNIIFNVDSIFVIDLKNNLKFVYEISKKIIADYSNNIESIICKFEKTSIPIL